MVAYPTPSSNPAAPAVFDDPSLKVSMVVQCNTAPSSELGVEATLNLTSYPVLTLPTDITSHIFILCLPTHGCVQLSPGTAPLIFVQICRHWGDVAISTCQLWRFIYLDFPCYAGQCMKSSEKAYRLLEMWVSRAKGHPSFFLGTR